MRTLRTITAVLLLLAFATGAAAKSYRIDRIHAEFTVRPDGTVRAVEHFTYSFDGRYSWAFRSIPLRKQDRVYDVTMAEGGEAYSESISEMPGSFTVSKSGDEVTVKWHYRARNETRTFTVGYTTEGAVTRHADIVDFYQNIFANQTGRAIGEVVADVTLPPGLDASELKVFSHGPLHGTVEILSGERVRASVSPLPNGSSVDVRVLAPARACAAMAAGAEAKLDAIMAEELALAEQSDRRREQAARLREERAAERERRERLSRTLLPVAIGLGVLSLVVWFTYFRRYGWPHDVTVHAVPGDPPSDHPPALVSYLTVRGVGAPAMVATLVDLSERGHLKITESRREKSGLFGRTSIERDYRFERVEGPDTLRPFERDLLDFMVGSVGNGRAFSMSELKKHAGKNRSKVHKWFMSWSKMVKEAAQRENFYEPYEASAVVPNVVMGVFVFAAGIVMTALTQSPIGAAPMGAGFVQALLTLTFTRHTPEGRRLALGWRGFRNHLKSISKATGKVTLTSPDWSRYLAVAIVFGMHKKLLPALALSDARGAQAVPVWYHAAMGGMGDSGVAGLADGFATMVTSVSATMSSSTGAGGGASGGGGGGAGGGSAGAG